MRDGRWVRNCTGTLVAASTILTAAHCVLDDAGNVIARRTRVVIPKPNGRYVQATVTSIAPHPDYVALIRSRGKRVANGSDLALLKVRPGLAQRHGLTPAPIASPAEVASLTGRGVSVFGYGDYIRGRRGMAAHPRKSADHAWVLQGECAVAGALCFAWNTAAVPDRAEIRNGDSGGPWMGWLGGWKVLGVVSGYIEKRGPWPVHAAGNPSAPANWNWILPQLA